MRVTAPGTEARTGGSVGPTAAAAPDPPAAPHPRGLWARLAAAAVADELPVEAEPPHVDFLRRMAEIDREYDQGLVAPEPPAGTADENVVDLQAARQRLRG